GGASVVGKTPGNPAANRACGVTDASADGDVIGNQRPRTKAKTLLNFGPGVNGCHPTRRPQGTPRTIRQLFRASPQGVENTHRPQPGEATWKDLTDNVN